MAEPLDVDEMRQVLGRVSTYRKVCEMVRSSAGHTIFSGFLFIGFAYLNMRMFGGIHPVVITMGLLGVGELLVGLWKKVRPSPECVLMDAILLTIFVGSIAFRQLLIVNAGRPVQPISIFFGLWILFDAVNTYRYYFNLRRVFVERPTEEHLEYVEDLAAEISEGDPTTDPTIIDIPTKPPVKAKLLGAIAIFLDVRSGLLFLCSRDEFDLRRDPDSQGDPKGLLVVFNDQFPPFPLDESTWKNYSNWRMSGR